MESFSAGLRGAYQGTASLVPRKANQPQEFETAYVPAARQHLQDFSPRSGRNKPSPPRKRWVIRATGPSPSGAAQPSPFCKSHFRSLKNRLFKHGLLMIILGCSSITPAQNAPLPAPPVFTESAASQLLNQITQGLAARNQKQVLAAFDLNKMQDGALFRQQMISFISHAENVRIYFHVTQASGDTAKGQAEAGVQMEADPRDSNNTVPVRKQARLHFAALSTPNGWKFTDVQPRNFFSLQP
jgi:hypothetical protein